MIRNKYTGRKNSDMPIENSRGIWWKIGYGFWLFINIVVAAGLICSAYAGMYNPTEVAGAGIVGMTLPGWFGAAVFIA
ncbi:MAG: hypothetical protein K2L80_07865, partial [Muribaculaceae bacterium]|nr:hypothetical protein [Muribaculaceae bacterium]